MVTSDNILLEKYDYIEDNVNKVYETVVTNLKGERFKTETDEAGTYIKCYYSNNPLYEDDEDGYYENDSIYNYTEQYGCTYNIDNLRYVFRD